MLKKTQITAKIHPFLVLHQPYLTFSHPCNCQMLKKLRQKQKIHPLLVLHHPLITFSHPCNCPMLKKLRKQQKYIHCWCCTTPFLHFHILAIARWLKNSESSKNTSICGVRIKPVTEGGQEFFTYKLLYWWKLYICGIVSISRRDENQTDRHSVCYQTWYLSLASLAALV